MVTQSSVISTKSGLAVDVDMYVGKVVRRELKSGRSVYSLEWLVKDRQFSTELCLQVYRS